MNTSNELSNRSRGGGVFAISLVVVVIFSGLFMAQQRRASEPEGHRLRVVTTILPLYVFARNVAGSAADVSLLVPPGTDLHEYTLTPSDATAIVEADVVVKNGYGLDGFVDDIVKTNARPGHVPAIVNAGELVDASRPGLGKGSPDGTFSMDQAKIDQSKYANPHIWVNPAYAVHMVEAIRNGLMRSDAKSASIFAMNAESYIQRIMEIDAQYRLAVRGFKKPIFIAEEQSMSYLAQEYGLTQAAILGPEPDLALSPRDVANIVGLMKEHRISVIFKNASSSGTGVDSIAKDANGKIYPFDAMETGSTEPDAYEAIMKKNLATLKQAFE